MAEVVKAKCLDCGKEFTQMLGPLALSETYRCQKCGEEKVVPNSEGAGMPEKCEKCGGPMGSNDKPMCPKCHSMHVIELGNIVSVD